MIHLTEYLKGRIKVEDIDELTMRHIVRLLSKMNVVRYLYNEPMIVTSGYRSPEYNVKIGGSANSAHCTGQAIDILDKDGKLKKWVESNISLFQELGLYMEHFDHTPNWVHFTTRRPKSGSRFFKP